MKNRSLFFLLLGVLFTWWGCSSKPQEAEITPQPLSYFSHVGSFNFDKNTRIAYDLDNEALADAVSWFTDFVQHGSGLSLTPVEISSLESSSNTLMINLVEEEEKSEAYHLHIRSNVISISAASVAGVFYAFQTLRQMMPSAIEASGKMQKISIPAAEIKDAPAYRWRGMHLDVSRHFFPVAFIKEYIDLIAFHKMNVFHWHLTDDNGWRIEIKKYPKLHEVAAWRVDREDMRWDEVTMPEPGEKATYGGYYTQEEIKEVVAYAAQRQVMVVPEIEMPGHTCEVLAAYPELGCTGGPYYVQPGIYWPNQDIFCAGNEQVFTFLEEVLEEVMALFPAPYIHIGGDEATKTAWESCPKCQKRIEDEKLANVEELQSYFIKRMERFLLSHGKKLIGWDEILEGGLAPEATVMSWRGTEGGIAAAKSGHDAIMTPVSHCYFDYYQADPEFEPLAIGGYTTLKKVYSFNPTPSVLNEEEAKHILGAQGNLWTEWVKTPEHAEYLVVPRMTALAEKLWTREEQCHWPDFQQRMRQLFTRFDLMGINYSEGSFKVEIETQYDAVNQAFNVSLETIGLSDAIYYTLNDTTPPDENALLYEKPFMVDKNTVIKAIAYKEGEPRERYSTTEVVLHKGIGKTATLKSPPADKYACEGTLTLLNGLFGSPRHSDGQWLGFWDKDMEMVVDLEQEESINRVSLHALAMPDIWIFLPQEVEVAYSTDGENFEVMGRRTHSINQQDCEQEIVPFIVEDKPVKARYIKVSAKNAGALPSWHGSAGNPSWIFVDEIVIEGE